MKRIATMLALACTIPAQVPAPRAGQPGAETELHSAWLSELLDLDTAGAARTYGGLAVDVKAPAGKKLVALARLLELQRIGAVEPQSIGIQHPEELPQAMREAYENPKALWPAFELFVAEARKGPPAVETWLQQQGERNQLQFSPRPLVSEIYNRAQESTDASTAREKRRQLLQLLADARSRNDQRKQVEITRQLALIVEPEVRSVQRSRGLYLLKLDLSGKRDDADRLRALWFPNERVSPLQGTPEQAWELVLANLDQLREQLRQRQDLQSDEPEQLQKLQEHLSAIAASSRGRAAALQELERWPPYRALLLRSR